jgi:gliding motility-associated-like protein
MRIVLTLIALLLPVIIFSQTADIDKGCAPLTVAFTPPAGAQTYFWDFKDGGSSNLSNPNNIFTTPGTYNVEFRKTPTGPVEGTIAITVWPKPDIKISAVPESGCRPLQVQFTDTTKLSGDVQVLNRLWVFGDGGSAANLLNPQHTYFSAGIFTVSVEYSTNYPSCNVTAVFSDKIKVGSKPQTSFVTSPNPAAACNPPLNVTFTNTTFGGSGALTYAWNFGNGNTSTDLNPPVQTYSSTGNFTVQLTATDPFGCSATALSTVKIGSPLAEFTIPDTVCIGAPYLINNQSDPGIYAWTFGPNASPMSSGVNQPTVTFNAAGPQTITLKVTGPGGCVSTKTKTIYVDKADASFSILPLNPCSEPISFNFKSLSSAASSWKWVFNDGTTSTLQNPVHLWTNPDTSIYTPDGLVLDTVFLTVTNPSGCSIDTMFVDSIWLANARFMPDAQHGCAPLTVVFADSSFSKTPITNWTWYFGDGSAPLVQTNGSNVSHQFTNPGEYDVKLAIRNSNGCIDTSYSIHIEVGAPINGDFTVDKLEICPGDTVHFNNLTNDPRVDGWHFTSDNSRLFHCYDEKSPYWVYDSEAGLQDVSLTIDYNGCFQTVTKSDLVKVKGPIAQLHYKTTCDNTLKFDFVNESFDAPNIKWYLGDGDSSLLDTFTHFYLQHGKYQVILMAENPGSGCAVSYDTAYVYPTQLKAAFDLPDTICGGSSYPLNGSTSIDVNATCYKGYTWYFTWDRPIRTDQASIDFDFGPSGPQTVWLEVEDINGCRDTIGDDIVIYNRDPKFAIDDDTICLPTTVGFTDKTTADAPIIEWQWAFGDGGTSTLPSTTHLYTTNPGTDNFFTVTLTVKDDKGCISTKKDSISIYAPISNVVTMPSPAQLCVGDTLKFIATDFTAGGSNLSWDWDFGNGFTGTGQIVKSPYITPGASIALLNYKEIATGCQGQLSIPVSVQSYPTAAFASNVDGQDIICYPQQMQFTNNSTSDYPVSIVWNLGNGVVSTGNTAATVFPKGTFSVVMTARTSFGCADDTTRTFTVVGPEGNFIMDKSLICKGDSILFTLKDTIDISTFSWSFGDGTTLDGNDPVSHTYNFVPPSGSTVAKLVLRGENDACAITVEHPVNFSLVDAQFNVLNPNICFGVPLSFINTSTEADISKWDFGDGTTSNANAPTHNYPIDGDYDVTLVVTDQPLGCKDTITQLISVQALPNIEAIGDTICLKDTAMIRVLNPIPGYSYSWEPGSLVLTPGNTALVKVIPEETTNFTVTVTDSQGCKGIDSAIVFVPTTYSAASDLDTLVSKGVQVLLPVQYDPNYIFTWTPPPGPGQPPLVTTKDSSITYTLTVEDFFGCTDKEFTFKIRVIPEKVWVPNVFTPNSDQVNDVFKILAEGEQELVEVKELKIFNRWGQLVFQGAGGNVTSVFWDGKYKGEDAPSDVYAWVAVVRFLTGKEEKLSGQLTLLR